MFFHGEPFDSKLAVKVFMTTSMWSTLNIRLFIMKNTATSVSNPKIASKKSPKGSKASTPGTKAAKLGATPKTSLNKSLNASSASDPSHPLDPLIGVATKSRSKKIKAIVKGAADIKRFYYRKSNTASKRSSLSIDTVLASLLVIRFGSDKKLRKWVAGQARLAQEAGLDAKSISRAVQENAIRIIADPELLKQLPAEEMAAAEQQVMMAQWLEKGSSASSSRVRRL